MSKMSDKEALTPGERKKEEENTEGKVELPPGFMGMNLQDSVRYTSGPEPKKELAKAAMARRAISVENGTSDKVEAKPIPEDPETIDGQSSKSKNQSMEQIPESEAPEKPPRAPQEGGSDDANHPLLDEADKGESDTQGTGPPQEEEGEGDKDRTFCCLTIKTRPSDKPDWPPKFQIKDIILAFVGFLTFAIDYGTDIRLLIFYYTEHRWMHLYLTAGFIVVPSVISGFISVIWYKMYYRRDVRHKYNHARTLYVFRIVLSFLQLGRLWRQGEYIYNASHSIRLEKQGEAKRDEAHRLRKRAIEEKRDSTILGLIDGFLESALQLLLQIYIAADSGYYVTEFPILSSLMSSWVSTSLIITTYYRANRKAQKDKDNVDYVSSLFYLLWRLFELGPRYILLGLCAAFFKPWSFIVAGAHVVFVTLLYRFTKAELEGICEDPIEEGPVENGDVPNTENGNEASTQQSQSKGCVAPVLRHAFLVVLGFIGLFSFINLKEGRTRYLTFVYYVVYYAENLLMVALLVWLADDRLSQPDSNVLVVAPIGIIGHVISAGVFYFLFHPQTSGKRRVIAPRFKLSCP